MPCSELRDKSLLTPPTAGVFAIEILAQCPGGGWRTLNEYKELFASQNYHLVDMKQVGASMHLMVWEKQ